MAKMGTSKQKLEGPKPLPPGIYDYRVDGFKPKLSANKASTNLSPIMKVINNPNVDLNDAKIFFNLNTNAGFIMPDFVHSLGLEMDMSDPNDANLPGDFHPDPADPENVEKLRYEGPILGRTGRLEIAIKKDPKTNKDQSYVKQFFCKVPGCTHKHSTALN